MFMLHDVLNNFFYTKIIRTRPTRWDKKWGFRKAVQYHFIGKPHNIEVAKYVYQFLRTTYRNLWWEFLPRRLQLIHEGDRLGYYLGLTEGLTETLRAQRDLLRKKVGSGLDLILVNNEKAISLYIKKEYEGKGDEGETTVNYRKAVYQEGI